MEAGRYGSVMDVYLAIMLEASQSVKMATWIHGPGVAHDHVRVPVVGEGWLVVDADHLGLVVVAVDVGRPVAGLLLLGRPVGAAAASAQTQTSAELQLYLHCQFSMCKINGVSSKMNGVKFKVHRLCKVDMIYLPC